MTDREQSGRKKVKFSAHQASKRNIRDPEDATPHRQSMPMRGRKVLFLPGGYIENQ